MAKRKMHTEQFKRDAVRIFEHRGTRTVTAVAESLGVRENQLYAWQKKYGAAVKTNQRGETLEVEVQRLERELAQVRRERDVLKKSIAVFVNDRT
jgi:transposase